MSDKEFKTIDARGLSCPQPVILTQNALSEGSGNYKVLVNSPTAKDNVKKFALQKGFYVEVEEESEDSVINITSE